MKTFIVSDLHGQKKVYDSMIKYLSAINDEVTLYILGDVVDKGYDGIGILQDIINRKNITIKMIAGNHELMLYDYLKNTNIKDFWPYVWSGGTRTLEELDKLTKEEKQEILDYISNLNIVESIKGIGQFKNITLAHARPFELENYNHLKLKDVNNPLYGLYILSHLFFKDKEEQYIIGLENNLTIIGHTPAYKTGNCYLYRESDNVLDIDGGCDRMKFYEDVISPLVEINYENNCLDFIGFNKDGEIVELFTLDIDKENKLIKK